MRSDYPALGNELIQLVAGRKTSTLTSIKEGPDLRSLQADAFLDLGAGSAAVSDFFNVSIFASLRRRLILRE